MAKLICFEGPDGVGKTTQAKILEDILLNKEYKVKYYKLPSKTFFGNLVYKYLKNGIARKYPNYFQLINFFDKSLFYIRHLLFSKYDYILLDRWKLSSLVYGESDNGKKWFLKFLYNITKTPDLTLIFFGNNFLDKREEKDDYEKDTEFNEKIKNLYLLYGYTQKKCLFVSANDTLDNISSNIESLFYQNFINNTEKNNGRAI
jgi:thymidylate kinase